jgi:ketosteroid isomerase-like protein
MDKESIKKTIIEMEIAALEKWNKGNPDGYLAIYSPDFTYFDPFQEKRLDGFEKIEELYESLRGKGSVERYEMIDPVVQTSENMAVLTYNLISYAGSEVYRWNCTEVYQLNENKQWKIIHNHWSLIKPLGDIPMV